MRFILANQATAAKRRVYFHLVDATDGITPETGEAAGQPQISTNGGAWTNTDIGTLNAIGNGRYYAELAQTAVATAGDIIETRYKSAATAECPGDSVQVVAFDLDDATRLGLSALPNAAADAAGGLPISDAGGLDLDAMNSNVSAILVDTGTTLENHLTDIKGTGFVKDTHSLPQCLTATGFSTHSAGAIWDVVKASHVTAGSFGEEVQAHSLSTELADGTVVAGSLDTQAKADVNAEVDTALADVNLDHLVGTPTGIPAVPAGTYLDQIMDDGTASYDRTTDSLQAIRDRGDSSWTTGSGTGLTAISTGTAQAGAAGSITLAVGEPSTTDIFVGCRILIHTGTGAKQERICTAYNGSTKVATVDRNWDVTPDATSQYEIQGAGADVATLLQDAQSLADLKDFADAGYDPATHKVQGVVTVDTNTDMRGTENAALATTALSTATWTAARAGYLDKLNVSGTLAHSDAASTYKATGFSIHSASDVWGVATRVLTAGTNIDGSTFTSLPDVTTDAASRTASKADVSALATVAALSDGTVQVGTVRDGAIGAAAVADIFSTITIAEAYSADAAEGTPAQLLYLILQGISEFAITSTTKTVKKLDGNTTAASYTLDDADAPTSITRSG